MIRKSALMVLIVFTLITAVALWLGKNGYLANTMAYALEEVVEAKVDIEGLVLNPFDMEVAFDKMVIANKDAPMRNLVELSQTRFKVNLLQLFAKKVVIEQMTVPGMVFNTARVSSGYLARFDKTGATSKHQTQKNLSADQPGFFSEQLKQGLSTIKADIPVLDLGALGKKLELDKIVNPDKLASITHIKASNEVAQQIFDAWDQRLDQNTIETDVKQLSADIKALDGIDIKNTVAVKNALSSIKKINKKSQTIKRAINDLSRQTQADVATLNERLSTADKFFEADVATAKRIANLGSIDATEAGKILFGHAVMERFSEVMAYINIARQYLPQSSVDDDEARPERRKGKDVSFPVTARVYPKLLIEQLALSGHHQGEFDADYSGEVLALSSNPELAGMPVSLQIDWTQQGKPSWQVEGLFDHQSEIALDHLQISADNLNLGSTQLGNRDQAYLPSTFVMPEAAVDIRLNIKGDVLDAVMMIDARRVSFDYAAVIEANEKNTTRASVREIFDDFEHVILEASIKGDVRSPKLRIASNFDALFSSRIKALFGKKIKAAEMKIRGEVKRHLNTKKAEYLAMIKEKQRRPLEKLATYQRKVDQYKAELDDKKKALEMALKQKAKQKTDLAVDKLKNKLKNQLKGFKF